MFVEIKKKYVSVILEIKTKRLLSVTLDSIFYVSYKCLQSIKCKCLCKQPMFVLVF